MDALVFIPGTWKDQLKNVVETIRKLRKVTGYEINIQKSKASLYSNRNQFKISMKENTPHIRAIETTIIYIDMLLIRNVHDPEKSNIKNLRNIKYLNK